MTNPSLKKLKDSAVNGILAAIVFASVFSAFCAYLLVDGSTTIPDKQKVVLVRGLAILGAVLLCGIVSLASLLLRHKWISLTSGALAGVPLCLLFPLGAIAGIPGFPIFVIGTAAGVLCLVNLFKPSFVRLWFDEKQTIERAIPPVSQEIEAKSVVAQIAYCSNCKKDVSIDEDYRCLECKWPVD